MLSKNNFNLRAENTNILNIENSGQTILSRPYTPVNDITPKRYKRKIKFKKKSSKKNPKLSKYESLLKDIDIFDYIGTLRSRKLDTVTKLLNLTKIEINNINMDSYSKYRLYRFISDDWYNLYVNSKIRKNVIKVFNKTYLHIPKRNSLNIMSHVMKLVNVRAMEPSSPISQVFDKSNNIVNTKPEYRRKLLFSFGVNNYTHWNSLSSAVNDAIQLDNLFKEKLSFDETIVYKNEEFSKKSFESLIKGKLYRDVHEDDLIVISFHGHGHSMTVDSKQLGFLVPPNASTKPTPDSLISTEDISNWTKYIPARHILLIFDCCFSGLSVMRNHNEILKSPDGNEKKTLRTDRFFRKLRANLSRKSRIIINAGLGHEKIADNIGGDNSALTHYIVNSPIIKNGSSCSVHQLFTNILTRVSSNHDQNPCMGYLKGHEGTDIFLGL